jgi:hypothetical protein
MKKTAIKKIVSSLAFLLVFASIISPLSAGAVLLDWENPNTGGSSQFKFSSSNISTSTLLMTVTGCTGAANRVSAAVTGFLSSAYNNSDKIVSWLDAGYVLDEAVRTADEKTKLEAKKANTLEECLNGIAFTLAKNQLTKMTRDAVNWVNSGFEGDPMYVRDVISMTNSIERNILERGIYQITDPNNAFPYGNDFSMSAINSYRSGSGLRTGFGGFFNNLTSDLGSFMTDPDTYTAGEVIVKDGSYKKVSASELKTTKEVIQNVIEMLVLKTGDPMPITIIANGDELSALLESLEKKQLIESWVATSTKATLNNVKNAIDDGYYNSQITAGDVDTAQNVLDLIIKGTTSQTGGYYYNGRYYSSTGGYGQATTKNAQQRAQEANDRFANDFSTGGWDAWQALTQRDQNNPLGFTMLASQRLLEQQIQQTQNTKDELAQNSGFLSQKKCVLWEEQEENGKPKYEDGVPITRKYAPEFGECTKWETITPGSIIKDNLSSYINSPQRQVELADSINEVLNNLFSKLIQKFQGQGLSSLSSWTTDVTDWSTSSGGVGSNKVFDTYGNDISLGYNVNDFRGFDLTKDLGNTYKRVAYIGRKWDAKTNTPELLPGIGQKGYYYIVSVGGTDVGLVPKVLISSGSGTRLVDKYVPYEWKSGDVVFFDGEKWGKYTQKNMPKKVIDKKGIIQIQQDYVKETNKFLDKLNDKEKGVMVKLGELDYCIPGPNPNWESNSSDVRDVYLDYISGFRAVTIDFTDKLIKGLISFISLGMVDVNAQKAYLYVPDWSIYKSFFDGTNLWDKITAVKPQLPFFTLLGAPRYTFQTGPYQNIWQYVEVKTPGVQLGTDDKIGTSIPAEGIELINPFTIGNSSYIGILDILIGETDLAGKSADIVDRQIQFWTNYVAKVGQEYRDKIKAVYGDGSPKGMLTPAYWDVAQGKTVTNGNYLEMAQAGLSLTRNMVSYDENIKETTVELENNVTQAIGNIYQLEEIKKEVDEIVKKAQKRRNDERRAAGLEEISAECAEIESVGYMDDGSAGSVDDGGGI